MAESLVREYHRPIWKAIVEELSPRVSNYQYGERFYTSADICRIFSVSQITALRVLAELEKGGLVRRVRRRGTVVTAVHKKITLRFVIPESLKESLSGHVYLRLHRGILEEARKSRVEIETVFEHYLPEALTTPNAAGYLILQELSPSAAALLKKKRAVCMYVHPASKEHDMAAVCVDSRQGAFDAVSYLISLGHNRIGFICGPLARLDSLGRFEGYRNALQAAGISYDPALVKETSGYQEQEDEKVLCGFLALTPAPTAFFTANDHRAFHILQFCRKNGIRIPEDISLVGYDNIPEAAHTAPALTTVDTNLETVGALAVRALMNTILTNNKENGMVIKPQLVVRKSCARNVSIRDG